MTRENSQMGMPEPAVQDHSGDVGFSGITSTQNHQYSQPMV